MSAYLIVNTGELDTCSGDLYSYVFSSSECGSGQCNFSNTGNAAIPIGDTYFGVQVVSILIPHTQGLMRQFPTARVQEFAMGQFKML